MKVLIVDDHVLFREGLASIIRGEEFEVVGLAGTVHEAVEKARDLQPDIILMDFGLPDGSGADAARTILMTQPDCKIIFLTVSDQDDHLFNAVRSGAKGYLLKTISPAKLLNAMRSVYKGESAMSRAMTLRLMEELARSKPAPTAEDALLASLTVRELDVLRELATGKTNKEIGADLLLSENTVRFHLHSIFEKLDVCDRHGAARFARENGLAVK